MDVNSLTAGKPCFGSSVTKAKKHPEGLPYDQRLLYMTWGSITYDYQWKHENLHFVELQFCFNAKLLWFQIFLIALVLQSDLVAFLVIFPKSRAVLLR